MDKDHIPFSLRQLRYFAAAAEAFSVTAASRQLHISQPSISAAIAELEDVFGAELFIRHHAQGLSLTPAGSQLLREARGLLKHAQELLTAAEDFAQRHTGPIAIGCLVTFAPMLLSKLTTTFTGQYTGARLQMVEGDQKALLAALGSGSLDCVLTYDLNLPEELIFRELVDLPPYVLLPVKHRLTKKVIVSLTDLCDEPMVLLDLPLSMEYFLSLFAAAGLKPTIAYRSPQADVVRAMVANGLGYSIWNFPFKGNTALDGQRFVVRPLQRGLRHTTLGLATINTLHTRKIVTAFSDFCGAEIPRLVNLGR